MDQVYELRHNRLEKIVNHALKLSRADKFVIILLILGFLASEQIISSNVPEDYVKDDLGLGLVEEIDNWELQVDRPIQSLLDFLWIIARHLWIPSALSLGYLYKKRILQLIKMHLTGSNTL